MVRRKLNDPFWDFVDKLDDACPFNCIFCAYKFAAGTSISRIKWHLSGVKGRGVRICEQVPVDVQDAARAAIDGPPQKKLKAVAGSSNNEVTNTISTSAQELNNQVMHGQMAQEGEPLSPGALAWFDSITDKGIEPMLDAPEIRKRTEQVCQECEVGICDFLSLSLEDNFVTNDVENLATGSVQHFERGSSHEWLSGDSSQPTDLLCLGLGGHSDQLCSSSLNNDVIMIDVENMIREVGQPVVKGSSHEGLPVNEEEPRGDSSQPTDLLCLTLGRYYNQHCTQSLNNDVIMNDVEKIVREPGQPVVRGSSGEGFKRIGDESRGDAFPIKKLVGGEFEKNKNAIWSWLMNDEASSSIGIYGMGGVGKTTLLMHIHNLLLTTQNTFPHVFWITISQDFSISKLQNLIAKEFHLDLSSEDNERKRAAKLSKELSRKKQWVLILDDLWNYFDFDEVGIPLQLKGCKLILTTRLLGVCQRMFCQKMIKVEPLSMEEAWILFVEKLGHDTVLPLEVEQIAKFVARECAGLPLGIITMAAAMRGVVDIREWRNVLRELEESKVRLDDMEPEVFRILRFSYTHLKDSSLQQCFLYCSLFPEDFMVDRHDLIGYLIDEGVIKGMKSRQAEFDKGHAMLNKLLNVCLLERCTSLGHESVRMHDLIRDMALQIQQENSPVMVKAGAQLKELPDAEEWAENLVRVSLVKNQIEEIPASHSPRCLSLSTLLLCHNGLRFIADSFLEKLHGLKVLDLSYTNIEKLPDSVFNLASLVSLLLSHCQKLRQVPFLKKLRTLKRLDLSNTALEKMPQGMDCLSNLRYLRLNGCGEKEFASGILPKLPNLQVLVLEEDNMSRYAPVTVKGKEVACLRKLETLECHFEGHFDFVEYLKSQDGTPSLSRYTILVGQLHEDDYELRREYSSRSKTVWLGNFSIRRDPGFSLFPYGIQELIIYKCNDARSLCEVSSLNDATQLECIRIDDCNNMESLVSSSWLCSAPPPSPSNCIFSGLKEFYCYGCTSMKKLFPPVLLPNLVNLEVIRVEKCEKMEEIIAGRDEEGVMGEEFCLPKLCVLMLKCLPELKSICSTILICNSLEVIAVEECRKLKRMPICLPLLDNENGQPSAPPSLDVIYIEPKEWWETVVEWEHPNAKDVLLPFVKFGDPTKHRFLRLDSYEYGNGVTDVIGDEYCKAE